MSKAEFMGEIKIKSTAEIVKDCEAEKMNKKDAREFVCEVLNRVFH